jgi:hypothetical protein
MRAYAFYQAMKMNDDARPARCCSDDVPIRKERRSSAPVRWSPKVARAFPGSLRFARAVLREQSHAQAPTVGARIIRLDGTHIGRVNEVFISLGSGTRALSIQPADQPDGSVILMSTAALEPASEPDVFVATDTGRSHNAA